MNADLTLRDQIVLGIEGANNGFSIGVMLKGEPKGLYYYNGGRTGSNKILGNIDHLLGELDIDKQKLDCVCINLGPGSFTSLRISIATAEAIAMGLNIPVYGVDGLRLIAATAAFFPKTVNVVLNAYKGELYTCRYDVSQGQPEPLNEIRLLEPAVFWETIKEGELVLGNGLFALQAAGYELEQKKAVWANRFHHQASGISVIEYFLDHLAKPPDITPLKPIYVRASEAEIHYKQKYFSLLSKSTSS